MEKKTNHYLEIFTVFFRLGLFAFGGPAAHVAMMEEEVVHKRKWISQDKFIDMLGFTNLIPGPNSTEMAIQLGYRRGGGLGLVLAGLGFIIPAVIVVLTFAMIYTKIGTVPSVVNIFDGIKPVILAVVVQAVFRLGKTVVKQLDAAILFVLVFVLSLLGVKEIPLLFSAGLLMLLFRYTRNGNRLMVVEPMSLSLLFLTFLKIGSVLYGSGYVLLAFLKTEFIDRFSVITTTELLDAVAIGQFTPGPVFTTATFIGYLTNGLLGAIIATLGIFLPSFLIVLLLTPLIDKIRSLKTVSFLLDGINAASIALMLSVTWKLGTATLISLPAFFIFLVSLFLSMKFKVNSTFLFLGGGVAGFLLSLI